MSKRSSCGHCLLTTFRVIQFLLSLVALGCGVWICYVMFSMADSAHTMEDIINTLLDPSQRQQIEDEMGSAFTDLDISDDDVAEAAEVLHSTLVPVLHVLEGTPVRAILISIAALWSTAVIVYLHFAQRSTTKAGHQLLPSEPNTPNLPSNHRPRRNRRSLRVCLSILTIVFWLVSLIASCMLAAEYSVVLFAGGAEMKIAFSTIKLLIQRAISSAIAGDEHAILRTLDIVDDILTIGALAILAIATSAICGAVEIISLFVACCVSGRVKHKPVQMQQYPQPYQHQYQQVRNVEAGEALMGNPGGYAYSNTPTPTQMEKRPMIAYTSYADDMSPATTHQTQMPMAAWSPNHGQPQIVSPVYNTTPSIVVSPTWNQVPVSSPLSPPQQYHAYSPETTGQIRRKPLA